jgi:PAS domain S-box-containing protein
MGGRRWTFKHIAAGFVASLAVALLITASSMLAMRSVLDANARLTEERVKRLEKAEQLRRFFSEALAAHRIQELTGNSLFQEEEAKARWRFALTLAELRSYSSGEEESRLLEEVGLSEAAHQVAHERRVAAWERKVPPGELRKVSRELSEARERCHELLNELHGFIEQQLDIGTLSARRSSQRAFWLILAVALLGVLGAMGLAWVLTRALWPLHHEAQATEERFRLLVEGVKDYALFLMDTEGRVASWNPGAERILGWKADDIIGRSGALIYPPEAVEAGQLGKDMARARREGRLALEGWRMCKNGTRFWAEMLLTPLRDGGGRLKGYAVLTRDITERNRAERAQRLFAEAEHLFHTGEDPDHAVVALARLLVPELADGCLLFLLTPAGELEPRAVAHVSPEKERLLWDIIHHGDPRRERPHGVWQVLRTERTKRVAEVMMHHLEEAADDAEHLALLRRLGVCSFLSVPLRAGGRVLGVLMVLSQRPERRFTEMEQVYLEELAGRAALALDNARLLREAQAALELIGVAAHDLGSPLHVLQLTLGKLRRTPPTDPDKLREGLTSALRATQRLGRLLHNLLDLSRLSSGRLDLEVVEVDLAELVREGVERYAEQAAEVGSRVELEVELGVVGRWDRLRLERVLANLLSNAFKYGRGKPIEVRVERAGGHARLAVRDQGPGIPLEEQRHIFERFKKAPSSQGKKEGFGLGLYIVRQLVEAHGGTLRVESTPGEGTTFTVELPLEAPGREVQPTARPGPLH